mmetsp:Transcript_9394/g.18601  ORF Transcript_9394/g.18601 Transcript_9394/m.18601 type:complete len:256 (-) Transcript_9394:1609-2376(-)
MIKFLGALVFFDWASIAVGLNGTSIANDPSRNVESKGCISKRSHFRITINSAVLAAVGRSFFGIEVVNLDFEQTIACFKLVAVSSLLTVTHVTVWAGSFLGTTVSILSKRRSSLLTCSLAAGITGAELLVGTFSNTDLGLLRFSRFNAFVASLTTDNNSRARGGGQGHIRAKFHRVSGLHLEAISWQTRVLDCTLGLNRLTLDEANRAGHEIRIIRATDIKEIIAGRVFNRNEKLVNPRIRRRIIGLNLNTHSAV